MDNGWAVVLGAAIAFVGTVVGKAVQDWLNDRRQRRDATREDLRAVTRKVLALTLEHSEFSTMTQPQQQDLMNRSLMCTTELIISAPPKEALIGAYVMAQWRRMLDEETGSSDYLSSILTDMSAWIRGEAGAAYLCSKRGLPH